MKRNIKDLLLDLAKLNINNSIYIVSKDLFNKQKYSIIKSNYNRYPKIHIDNNTIYLPPLSDIQGFFNNKEEAQKLVDKLNKGE